MKVNTEPNFVHRRREPRYFVCRLLPEDGGYAEGYRYRVELLDEDGRSGAIVMFRGDESPLQCDVYAVPELVFRAALSRFDTPGDYVSSAGESMMPF